MGGVFSTRPAGLMIMTSEALPTAASNSALAFMRDGTRAIADGCVALAHVC